MDYSESTKVVFQRIEKLDPENVSKIMGYLLLKDHGQLEMIRLAFVPDNAIQSLIDNVKKELALLSPKPPVSSPPSNNLPTNFTPFTPSPSSLPSSWPCALDTCQWIVPQPPTGQHLVQNFQYITGGYIIQNQPQLVFVDDQMRSCNLDALYFPVHSPPDQICPQSSFQICHNFNQGYCKHGGNCRLLHILRMDNGCFMVLNPPKTGDDHVLLSHTSLRQLEIELIGLLKCRRGVPVSISSLPIFYYDKYGRVLQVQGYLMEIPGKGKIRFNLTQIIAQMTKCIRLIDRPHGRQSVILVEDIPRYTRLVEEKTENESSSCQVYLTFPPQSMFTEEDVYSYFNNFGPVQEVRLPNQDKRMFGFVTFVYSETVALVLTKTNPHFICGAKVLVKPYRTKPMLVNRKAEERVEHPVHIEPYLLDAESSPPAKKFEKNKQINEGKEQCDGSSLIEEGVSSNGCTSSEDKVDHLKSYNHKQNSCEEVNLPERPFEDGVWV